MAQPYVKSLLGSTEIVLIETRQHWMAAVRFALRPIVIALIGLGLLLLNNIFDFGDGALGIINDIVRWVVVILFLVAIVWLPIDLIRWDSRRYVLTNRRVMRVEGVLRKQSVDSSLEQITDIGLVDPTLGRFFGYADLTIFTASDNANEQYEQLLDGLQFKKAVLDAKEAIRSGNPLTELPADFVVKGGTNEASMRADGKLVDEAVTADEGSASAAAGAAPATTAAAVVAATPVAEPVAHVDEPAPELATPLTAADLEAETGPASMAVSEPIAEPAFVVEPEPEPVLEPAPAVEPEPALEPEPAPAPEPAPEPEPATDTEPEPEPALDTEPEPASHVDEPWPETDRAASDVADDSSSDAASDAEADDERKDGPTTV